MEKELISKKELLEQTGISYGQLYRWKRKGLIPEEWFIRRSAFTGQETFFPRERMLARVERIKSMKDDVALDDLAGVFSPAVPNLRLSFADVSKRNIVSLSLLESYRRLRPRKETFSFGDLVALLVFGRLMEAGTLSLPEGGELLSALEAAQNLGNKPWILLAARKLGVFVCLLAERPEQVVLDPGLKILTQISLADIAGELKEKLLGI